MKILICTVLWTKYFDFGILIFNFEFIKGIFQGKY